MNFILTAVVVLGAIALIAAVVLYAVSKRFAVAEDPRIDEVTQTLPGANCGGCGYAGCAAMAQALVRGADAGSIDGLLCPVGGQATMDRVAGLLGMAAAAAERRVAVVRCAGSCDRRPQVAAYDGLRTCATMAMAGAGESACGYGCLGCGDCTRACQFGAIAINPVTHLPEVDEERCTACGKCAAVCPRHIIELRPQSQRIHVACMNRDKGAIARRACQAACIGCSKCFKTCQHQAITIEANLSYIDADKCQQCGECVAACPTGAIIQKN